MTAAANCLRNNGAYLLSLPFSFNASPLQSCPPRTRARPIVPIWWNDAFTGLCETRNDYVTALAVGFVRYLHQLSLKRFASHNSARNNIPVKHEGSKHSTVNLVCWYNQTTCTRDVQACACRWLQAYIKQWCNNKAEILLPLRIFLLNRPRYHMAYGQLYLIKTQKA
jgi:hypothetical protein